MYLPSLGRTGNRWWQCDEWGQRKARPCGFVAFRMATRGRLLKAQAGKKGRTSWNSVKRSESERGNNSDHNLKLFWCRSFTIPEAWWSYGQDWAEDGQWSLAPGLVPVWPDVKPLASYSLFDSMPRYEHWANNAPQTWRPAQPAASWSQLASFPGMPLVGSV